MTTPGWESGGAIKVARAKEHIHDLEAAIAAFLKDENPHGIVRHEDPKTRDVRWYAVVLSKPPLRLGAIAGDAIHNLRTALDMMWLGVMYPGAKAETKRGQQFRVYDSRRDFQKAEGTRKVRSGRKAAHDIYRALHPYKGGNDLLWSLVHLDNVDKHELLIPVISALSPFTFEVWSPIDSEEPIDRFVALLALEPPSRRYPLDKIQQIFYLPGRLRDTMDAEPKVTLEIAVGEAGATNTGNPIVGVLNDFAGLVEGIVDTYRGAGLLAILAALFIPSAAIHSAPGVCSMLLP